MVMNGGSMAYTAMLVTKAVNEISNPTAKLQADLDSLAMTITYMEGLDDNEPDMREWLAAAVSEAAISTVAICKKYNVTAEDVVTWINKKFK